MIKVLFVCLGNICRSPAAEGVFRALIRDHGLDGRIDVDSAATSDMQVGRPPDPRTQAVAERRGLDVSNLRARRIASADFDRFDHVIAMDRANLADLHAICPPSRSDRVRLFLEVARDPSRLEIPDPYLTSGLAPFETMFDLIETGSVGLLRWLQQAHRLEPAARSPAPASAAIPDSRR